MSLLLIKHLSFQMEDKVLYQNADFALHRGEHLGVTGPNGAGKSTLFKLLQGEYLPDHGDILWQPGVKVGYLDQHLEIDPSLSVFDFMATAYAHLLAADRELNHLYAKMSSAVSDATLNRAAELQSLLEEEGFYRLTHRIEQVASGLGILPLGMTTHMSFLSGGQRHKVILAKLILEAPDVLLLDEPTNFLDTDHVTWLAEFLNQYPGTFMVVSHDTAFLNQIADGICDIDHQHIRKYKGGYARAMAQKELETLNQLKQYQSQQQKIDKLEAYISKNGAGVNAKIANGRKKQLAKIERCNKPQQKSQPEFGFSHEPLSAQTVLSATRLEIGYQHTLLPALNLDIQRGEKLAIVGFNGLGKSTLLKTLLGQLNPLAGEVRQANGIQWGYFSQDLHWDYPDSTPIQVMRTSCRQLNDKSARQKLAEFGINGGKSLQPLCSLSGGEQTKVKLSCLAVCKSNVLVLDEPTTHLDVDVKDALKQALCTYAGTVIVVSHEPDFLANWPDRVIDMAKMEMSDAK
ncbi:ABC-F family ATP-binding cassette domain-containing protein [Vibrio kanaloae]|uniref:ABC-F family ATP-binding cassette domain-containing protein n=1 Tax=Vibrio kanaloae TaxID=170673 RepID=A0A4U1YSX2_9VIBR|nr:ABC-F family ATP-binding cassette domain-containing protein [Vibrio kanaloae]NOI00233.1 ABC-F family ATP-binding cassette domain-containing protein [Vibrio kanaloae]TKF24424.1 ABC-F family ATP-binding cassette domain-containing protein [Vibrio kanaloae]